MNYSTLTHVIPQVSTINPQDYSASAPRCPCGALLRVWMWTRPRGTLKAWQPIGRCETCGKVARS